MILISERNRSIDILRAVSILIVVLGHYGLLGQLQSHITSSPPEHNFIYFGGIHGVYLFFMISGFLMGSIYEKKEYKPFLKRRWIRLIPVFIMASGIAFIIEYYFPEGVAGRNSSIKDYLETLVYTSSFGLFKGDLTQGAYWSLIVEFKFYLILAFFMFIKLSLNKAIISLCAISLLSFFTDSEKQTLFASIPFFAIGMASWKVWGEQQEAKKTYAILALTVLCLLLLCTIEIQTSSFPLRNQDIVEMSLLVTMFILTIKYRNALVFNSKIFSPIIFIGLVSFPFYIIHQETGMIVEYLVNNSFKLDFFIVFLIKILVSFALAVFVHLTLERRFLSARKEKNNTLKKGGNPPEN